MKHRCTRAKWCDKCSYRIDEKTGFMDWSTVKPYADMQSELQQLFAAAQEVTGVSL